jgi:hypothetical protein
MAGLPPPPINDKPGSFTWLEWYRQLRAYVSTTGSVPWSIIDFAGSELADISSKDHDILSGIQGGGTGEHYHLTAAQVTQIVANLHNSLSGLQGGSSTQRYHIPATTSTDVMEYLAGGTTGYGWNDLIGTPQIRAPGVNDPAWAVYRGTIRQHQFSNLNMNELWFTYHMPHDYKPGSDIHLHVHWSQNVIDTGGTAGVPGNVKWYADVMYAKGHNQAAFPATITTSMVDTASGTAYQHMLKEVQLSATSPSASQIDTDNLEPDGIILLRLYRDPTDVADTLNQAPFLLTCDIHYQIDRVNTKNKVPNFYS